MQADPYPCVTGMHSANSDYFFLGFIVTLYYPYNYLVPGTILAEISTYFDVGCICVRTSIVKEFRCQHQTITSDRISVFDDSL